MQSPATLLVVDNLEISKEFYVSILGLEIVEELTDCIKLSIGHHNVYMFQVTMTSVDYQHGYHANSTLLFTVKNLSDEIKRLKSQGVVFVHQSPNQNIWGRYAAFKDPSGIVHELMELFSQ